MRAMTANVVTTFQHRSFDGRKKDRPCPKSLQDIGRELWQKFCGIDIDLRGESVEKDTALRKKKLIPENRIPGYNHLLSHRKEYGKKGV